MEPPLPTLPIASNKHCTANYREEVEAEVEEEAEEEEVGEVEEDHHPLNLRPMCPNNLLNRSKM